MVQDPAPASPPPISAPAAGTPGLPVGLVRRADGIYFDLSISAQTLKAAINHVFLSNACLSGLAYPVLIKVLYGVGPDLGDVTEVRLARELRAIDPRRLPLYKNPKMGRSYAEYFFENLYFEAEELPDGSVLPERQARLDVDEFIAQMWGKGIQFGLDVAAVTAAIAATKPERITIATDLEAEPGLDAAVAEVTTDLRRSDAPRTRADGRVDLHSFQNRFPQIKKNMRLLKKLPPAPGQPGFDMAGRLTPATTPKDLSLAGLAGEGTEVQQHEDGEYLVSTREGFLNVDPKSERISVTDKIISKEGVSGRTTGNLQLTGAYEEYGDVQEQREVTGGAITVHGHVYGHIRSRGGPVVLDRNLVSGSVDNQGGDITVAGVASSSTIHTRSGKIVIGRAENCVISGTSVTVQEASNCEIVGDEVRISVAEGCAVAGRNIDIESAGPRRRAEMLVYVLVRELGGYDKECAELEARIAGFAASMQAGQQEIARVAALPEVRRYLTLSARLRGQDITLTPEQNKQLRKIADTVRSEIDAIASLRRELQAAQTQKTLLDERLARVGEQKAAAAGAARCGLRMVMGETTVRTMPVAADAPAPTQARAAGPVSAPSAAPAPALALLPAREIRQRLRGTPSGGELLFHGGGGVLDWHLGAGPG